MALMMNKRRKGPSTGNWMFLVPELSKSPSAIKYQYVLQSADENDHPPTHVHAWSY